MELEQKHRTEAALATAAIRTELKATFPRVKFRIRSDNFSGGDSVDIEYMDAMPAAEVEAIAGKYQYGHFDGMTDSYEYSNKREGIPQVRFVTVQRRMSEDAKVRIKAEIMRSYGITEQEWNDSSAFFDRFQCWQDQLVWRDFSERTLVM